MQCWYYRTIVEEFMGFSYETAVQFFRAFLKHYLGTEDEDRLREVTEKAALPGYSRMIRRIRKKGALSEEDRGRIRLYVEKIAALTEKLDTLSF
jgi:hypothetical protein